MKKTYSFYTLQIQKLVAIALVLSSNQSIKAQDFDCFANLKYRYSTQPYEFDTLSKSAVCKIGEKYEYHFKIIRNKDYKISFFASTVFNNELNFKILDNGTGEVLSSSNNTLDSIRQNNFLTDYFDSKQNKLVHPSYKLSEDDECEIKIVIEIPNKNSEVNNNEESILVLNEQKKGCVTIFIESKMKELDGF